MMAEDFVPRPRMGNPHQFSPFASLQCLPLARNLVRIPMVLRLIAVLAASGYPVLAQETAPQQFAKADHAAGRSYAISFPDHQGQSNFVKFTFPRETLKVVSLGLPTPAVVRSNVQQLETESNRYTLGLLKSQAALLNRQLPAGLQLRAESNPGGILLSLEGEFQAPKQDVPRIKAQNRKVLEAFQKFYEDLLSEDPAVMNALLKSGITNRTAYLAARRRSWFSQHGLVLETGRRRAYRPDYVVIARNFAPRLAPLSQSLSRPGDDPRRFLARSLAFYQSIPYETLGTGNDLEGDLGYLTPLSVVDLNRGDCDSKSVALWSLMKVRYPAVPVVLLLLPSHALLGVGITPAAGEATFDHQGRRYVLIEPAGPALLPLGRVSPPTAEAIQRREVRQVLQLP